MKILDTAMTEIVKGNSARYYSKYVVDGEEHTDTLNNFKFQNMINPNNEITIGNTCSSGVTFSIYMPTTSLTDVRRTMSSIKRIIKLNRNRQRAIKEKDFRKFYTFSCKIHLIERMDKVPIGSYILR